MRCMVMLGFLVALCTSLFAESTRPCLRACVVYESPECPAVTCYKNDAHRIKAALSSIAHSLRIPLRLEMRAHKTLSPSALNQWIRSVSSNDIAVVFYAGTGRCREQKNGMWPVMTIPAHEGCTLAYGEDEVASQIASRNPRLSLILFDCYSHLTTRRQSHSVGLSKKVRLSRNCLGIRKLFLQSRGTVTACSAQRGMPSYGVVAKKTSGGVFTSRFLHLLQKDQSSLTSWEVFCSHLKHVACQNLPSLQSPDAVVVSAKRM